MEGYFYKGRTCGEDEYAFLLNTTTNRVVKRSEVPGYWSWGGVGWMWVDTSNVMIGKESNGKAKEGS